GCTLRNDGDREFFPTGGGNVAAVGARAAARNGDTEGGDRSEADAAPPHEGSAFHRAPRDENSSTTTEAIVLGGTAGNRIVRPAAFFSRSSGRLSASRYARAGAALIPVSSRRPFIGQSNTCAYPVLPPPFDV